MEGRGTDPDHIVGGFVAAPGENPTRIVGMIKNLGTFTIGASLGLFCSGSLVWEMRR